MPSSYFKAVQEIKKWPGVGQKSAERLAFHFYELDSERFSRMGAILSDFRRQTRVCATCGLYSEYDPCRICSSEKRSDKKLCLVATVLDAFAIERSGGYNGKYHVLGGLVAPVKAITLEQLNVSTLSERLNPVEEIILAFEQTLDAEATIHALRRAYSEHNLHWTRLAMGIPSGAGLDNIDEQTIKKSFINRESIQ